MQDGGMDVRCEHQCKQQWTEMATDEYILDCALEAVVKCTDPVLELPPYHDFCWCHRWSLLSGYCEGDFNDIALPH